MQNFGTVKPGTKLYVEFDSFGADGESITLTGLESILNMDNDDYVVMRTSFKEGAHTILFSPDKTMRIIPAIIDDAEIKSIIKGHRTKNYPWKTTKIKGTETPYYIQGSNDKIHMPG